MKNEFEFKAELQKSLSQAAAPSSLYRFAKEVPDMWEREQSASTLTRKADMRRRLKILPILSKSSAAIIILTGAFYIGVSTSPVFAEYMKGVPGFSIAVDWLTQLRDRDGVQVAVNHGYTPIEPKTAQFGATTVTISDVYVTEDELLFKAFIRTDEYDVTDNRSNIYFQIVPQNLRGGGSTTYHSITETTDAAKEPILQASYKFHLSEHEVREFLEKEKELIFEVTKLTFNRETRHPEFETKGTIALPIDQKKLLHNKVYEPNQALPIAASDPDWEQLTLEKLTIQPTTMNAVILGKQGWTLYFPSEDGAAPYLKDEKGNVYTYDPSGPVLMLEGGKMQLPFLLSIFFETEAKTLQLHVGTVLVTENAPSGSFELSKNDTFPKKVSFKNRNIVIEEANFHDGYIHLKIKKEFPEQNMLEGISFLIPEYQAELANNEEVGKRLDALRQELKIYGWDRAESYGSNPSYLDVYIPAPKQDSYTISLQRVYDPIVVNQDYSITLAPNSFKGLPNH